MGGLFHRRGDVFQLANGKIKSFNCYPSGTVVLSPLGLLQKLEGVLGR